MSTAGAAAPLLAAALALATATRCAAAEPPPPAVDQAAGLGFRGAQARAHVARQLEFGPRYTGSPGSVRTAAWLVGELDGAGWTTVRQEFAVAGTTGVNVFAWSGSGPTLLLGTHYDTRRVADADPDPLRRSDPSPGANDGGSGTALLVELARVLDLSRAGHTVCLAFFDAEDNGNLPGWEDWSLGSRHFVSHRGQVPACARPRAVVIVDMVGDPVQTLHRDRNSDATLTEAIWTLAQGMGQGTWWLDTAPYRLIDDHLPFIEAGFPAALVIDFQSSRWHTTADTLDGIDLESIERVGRVLEAWIEGAAPF